MTLGAISSILRKELLIEFRDKNVINAYLLLSILILSSFRFAFKDLPEEITPLAAPIIWTTIFFSGMFSLVPTYKREMEGNTFEALRLSPTQASDIFFGKLLASFIVVLMLELTSVMVFFVFFPVPEPDMGALFVILLLGTFAFVTLGNFVSAITAPLPRSEILLPVLLIPLLLFTVIMTAVSATAQIFDGASLGDVGESVRFIFGFGLIFLALGYALIDFVVEH